MTANVLLIAEAEGKTKKVYGVLDRSGLCLIENKNDVTGGNGARHEVVPGKGKLVNAVNANVMRLFKKHGLPVAFQRLHGDTTFYSKRCTMIPIEVVVRGEASGSYVKRFPHVKKGEVFSRPQLELYLKTSNKMWKGEKIPDDDPLMISDVRGRFNLYLPGVPFAPHASFKTIMFEDVVPERKWHKVLGDISPTALYAFERLRSEFHKLDARLIDFKLEFGFDANGHLMIADVISPDEWRLIYKGEHADKQPFREGGTGEDLLRRYQIAADLTTRF